MEKINILDQDFEIIDVFESSVTIPDSFVAQQNKFGKGHGEGKLYIGNKQKMHDFFGQGDLSCFLLMSDINMYIKNVHMASSVLTSIYQTSQSGNKATNILRNIKADVAALSLKRLDFQIAEHLRLQGPRGYVHSVHPREKDGYYYLRCWSLPFITFVRIMKLRSISSKRIVFYWKLFANFDEMFEQVNYIKKYGAKNDTTKARNGQSQYRNELVSEFHSCPFTKISDEHLLIASHIKPWAVCNSKEKYDKNNGLLLSPLYDKLFDKGYITFDGYGNLRRSSWLSYKDWMKINPPSWVNIHIMDNLERQKYMRFHQEFIFLG